MTGNNGISLAIPDMHWDDFTKEESGLDAGEEILVLKVSKINRKGAGNGPFLQIQIFQVFFKDSSVDFVLPIAQELKSSQYHHSGQDLVNLSVDPGLRLGLVS